MKHRDKRYGSFWDERHCRLRNANDGHCRLWRHAMTEDIVIFEMQIMVIVAFEGMQWLKTLSSSKCKWWSLPPLKACNDWRHCHIRNANNGHCRLWRHAMTEDIVVFEMQMKVIVAFWKHAITKDIVVFEMQLKVIVAFWKHAMTEDIVVFEVKMKVIVTFEGMQWLKTLSSSKCKWWSLSPLKACND